MIPRPAISDAILARLRAGDASSAELEQITARSQSWVSAALRRLIDQGSVVRMGSRRGTRYALSREISSIGSSWPLYRVGREGAPVQIGSSECLGGRPVLPRGNHGSDQRGLWGATFKRWDSLSAPRPASGRLLGRTIPQQYPQLHAPSRVQDWTDEHYLRYLTHCGSDAVGDLILGSAALDDYLLRQRQLAPHDIGQRNRYFPELAEQSMQGGVPGPSVQGEHPKFAVTLIEQGEVRHALVKFSPPVDTLVGKRWSDLLIAEHVALETLRAAQISSAKSRLFQFENRTYLEVERFDRVGLGGRIGVTSLLAIDTGFYGEVDSWIECGAAITSGAAHRHCDIGGDPAHINLCRPHCEYRQAFWKSRLL